MADLPKRSEYEAQLSKEIADILRANRAEWESGVTETPETERSLREKLYAMLLLIFTIGSATAAGELGIGLIAQGSAGAWAESYSWSLARNITQGVRRRLTGARAKDLTGDAGLVQAVADSVVKQSTWGNKAATEITRANTAGGEFTAMVYNIGRVSPASAPGEGPVIGTPAQDVPAVTPLGLPELTPPPVPPDKIALPEPALALWHVNTDASGKPDDRVCKVCRPWHGRPRDEWERVFPLGPPAHEACRCYVDYQSPEKAEA